MKKLMLMLCAVASLTLFFSFSNTSDAANPRANFNRGYRAGVRAVNRGSFRVGPARVRYVAPRGYYNQGYYNRGYYNRGYYGRGYYGGGFGGYGGRSGLYIRF